MMIEDDGNDGDGEEEESEKNGNEDEDKDKKKAKNVNINTKGGGPTAFAKDMRTVFNNYLHLEEKDTPLYNSAKEMRTEFNRLYKQYVEEPFLQSNASTDNDIIVNNNKKKQNDKMDVDKNSGSDNDGDSSDEEEDEYDEEWLELRQTSIAAASLPFHQLELNQKVNLLKWLCYEVMESDVVRDQMDDLHDMDKTLRREREAMKKKIRKVSKEQSWAYRAETISKIASGSKSSGHTESKSGCIK